MKVKIGDTIHDPEVEPIMLILSAVDKTNIANMPPENTKYCAYPEKRDAHEIEEWMYKGGEHDNQS